MESLVSLQAYPKDLRNYLRTHRIPRVFEALITGVTVMCVRDPSLDPYQFIADKLRELKAGQHDDLSWDSFVAPGMRPARRPMISTSFFGDDENSQPTPEMYEKAYEFMKYNIFKFYFQAWKDFHALMQWEREEEERKRNMAVIQHSHTVLQRLFGKWKAYTKRKMKRVLAGEAKLRRLNCRRIMKVVLLAWQESAQQSAQTNKWFKSREYGEGNEPGEDEEWYYPEGQDYVSLIPRNVAVKIITFTGIKGVCRCARVCRTWKEITEDPAVWSNVNLSVAKNHVTDLVLLRLINKCRPFLGHLNLRGCHMLTEGALQHIGECRNLQDLNLSEYGKLDDEGIRSIATGCVGLLYLNLSYCLATDATLIALSKYCTNLRYLSLAYCTKFTSKGLHYISVGKGCRKLVHLDLSGCTQLTADCMKYIGRGCPVINILNLDDIPDLDDDLILALVNHCTTLRHLSILGGSCITDHSVKRLAIQSKKLRSIKIENNMLISDMSLRALGKVCRDLRHIYLAGCSRITDHGMKSLGTLKQLQMINIADCIRVTDLGVRHIIESASGTSIQELNVTNCFKVSDVTLLRISQRCRSLVYVSFCYCEHITDAGVELMGHMPSLISLDLTGCCLTDQGVSALGHNPQFRSLILAECSEITDLGMEKMLVNLPSLELLDLSECENITDATVKAIVFHCRMLRSLSVAGCYRLTDTSVKYLAQHSPYLSILNYSSSNITDIALRLLRRNCNNLKQLTIYCCCGVSREAVTKLQKQCPQVEYSPDQPLRPLPQLSVNS
ncbi:F-box and leucine-rich repeat protein 13-like isoform X2 [Dysidea avara]|uniref:F-box and leucine-rich repeat protein 13-like isoform X2 n=1 Tax=Dysidea avara TaxID=196820 RepID=UPI00331C2479